MCAKPSCYKDRHHVYWPRKKYRSKLERKFRNLPQNIIEMWRCEHTDLHRTTKPPKKPSAHEMRRAIEASRGC